MNLELIIVPPQKCPPFLVMLTTQGNSLGTASPPPTTRAPRYPVTVSPHGTSATEIKEEKNKINNNVRRINKYDND